MSTERKVAVVTGASQGIGAELVRAFLKNGYRVVANSRNIPALRVLSDVGVDQAVALFDRAGVKGIRYDPDAYGLSLAIGGLHG